MLDRSYHGSVRGVVCQFYAQDGQSMKLKASEGNGSRKASSPLQFREKAINDGWT